MSGFAAVCGLALLALVLSMTLKKDAPAIAFLLTLAAGVVILLHVFSRIGDSMLRLESLLSQSGMDGSLYLPVAKAVGAAAVVRVMGSLCRDAGQSALAVKLEIAGTVIALSFCLPLLEQVMGLIADWTL